MDYIIDGYSIPTDFYLTREGAVFYIPDNLPKETLKKLKDKIAFEQDVVRFIRTKELQAKFRGEQFQQAHDALMKLYQS